MNVYEEFKWIADLNGLRHQLVDRLAEYLDDDIYNLSLETAYVVRDCYEADGHLYDSKDRQLDNSGLVDCDYYCMSHSGYSEDEFYGVLYFGTTDSRTFVAVPYYSMN